MTHVIFFDKQTFVTQESNLNTFLYNLYVKGANTHAYIHIHRPVEHIPFLRVRGKAQIHTHNFAIAESVTEKQMQAKTHAGYMTWLRMPRKRYRTHKDMRSAILYLSWGLWPISPVSPLYPLGPLHQSRPLS